MNCYKLFCFLWCFDSIERQNAIKKYKLKGLVQNHHIIPRQWRNHPKVLDANFSIDASVNLMLMPTHYGKDFIKTKRKVHSGGHNYYNYYVKKLLDSEAGVESIRVLLKQELRNGESIPWS